MENEDVRIKQSIILDSEEPLTHGERDNFYEVGCGIWTFCTV